MIEATDGPTLSHYGAGLVDELKEVSQSDYKHLIEKRLAAQTAYSNKWKATKGPVSHRALDVLLTSVFPYCAVRGKDSR
jgi:hypothetical protein